MVMIVGSGERERESGNALFDGKDGAKSIRLFLFPGKNKYYFRGNRMCISNVSERSWNIKFDCVSFLLDFFFSGFPFIFILPDSILLLLLLLLLFSTLL